MQVVYWFSVAATL